MTTLKNKKGVSLVELIAVIVIMGIIATVGGISVATIIKNANESADKQACSDVLAAGKAYLQQHQNDSSFKGYVTVEELKNELEATTYKKFDGKTSTVYVYVLADMTTYGIDTATGTVDRPDSAKNGSIVMKNCTVYYVVADGTFTTTNPSAS